MSELSFDTDAVTNKVVPALKNSITSIGKAATTASTWKIPSDFTYRQLCINAQSAISEISTDLSTNVHGTILDFMEVLNAAEKKAVADMMGIELDPKGGANNNFWVDLDIILNAHAHSPEEIQEAIDDIGNSLRKCRVQNMVCASYCCRKTWRRSTCNFFSHNTRKSNTTEYIFR